MCDLICPVAAVVVIKVVKKTKTKPGARSLMTWVWLQFAPMKDTLLKLNGRVVYLQQNTEKQTTKWWESVKTVM